MTDYWRKNGGVPQPLPSEDISEDGRSWTNLANNADGRTVCGWVEAFGPPTYDAASETLAWNTEAEDWVVSPQPLDSIKWRVIEAVRQHRWITENSGVTVSGMLVSSDERTQNRVSNALTAFDEDVEMITVSWEVQPAVFITVDRAAVSAIGTAISRKLQACFTKSKLLIDTIQACTTAEEVLAIDIYDGWPTTGA